MKKKYLFKNLFCVLILTALIFSLTACSSGQTSSGDNIGAAAEDISAAVEEPQGDNTEDAAVAEDDESPADENTTNDSTDGTDGAAFTESQWHDLYASIGEELYFQYLFYNRDVVWPEYKNSNGEIIDEDHAWNYLYVNLCNYDPHHYLGKVSDDMMPSEENVELMNTVLRGILYWSADNPSVSYTRLYEQLQLTDGDLSYLAESIPANIIFEE